jgi:hypothetical protein
MMAAYLTRTSAATIAATCVTAQVSAYLAASTAQQDAALAQASEDIDAAMRYQGRKYDPDGTVTGTVQEREFPRIAYGDASQWSVVSGQWPGEVGAVWNWDTTTNTAVVPANVLRAVVLQANDRILGTRLAAMAARQGLQSQSTGGLSETFSQGSQISGSQISENILCPDALAIMSRYRLRQGKLL